MRSFDVIVDFSINKLSPGNFPHKNAVMRSSAVFFDLSTGNLLNTQLIADDLKRHDFDVTTL